MVEQGERWVPEDYGLADRRLDERTGQIEITFDLPEDCSVKISVLDSTGREIACLVDHELVAGHYQRVWDSRERTGGSVSPGVFYLRLDANPLTSNKKPVSLMKMILLR